MTDVGRNALYFEDYVLAIQHFNQVIAAKPYLAQPYYLRAIAKYSLDDFAGAELDATAALDLNPFLPDAWEVRGVVRQSLNRPAEAVGDYAQALQLLPFNRRLLFSKALAEEEAGLTAQADSTFGVLLRAYPAFDNGYVGRAQLRLHQQDTIAARADLQLALQANPNSVPALSLSAAIAPSDSASLAFMERAVSLQPDQAALRVNRAIARYRTGDLNGALNDFDYVVAADPLNFQALFNRAMLRVELHDNDRALTDLNRALRLRPNDHRALFNRAQVLTEKRQYDQARADVDTILAAFPTLFAAHLLRSEINEKAGRPVAAKADLNRAYALAHRVAPTSAKGEDYEAPEERVADRFNALLSMNEEIEAPEQTFNTAGLRGRVQNNIAAVEPLPLYRLSYYQVNPSAEISTSAYVRQIHELNEATALPFIIYVTNSVPRQTPEAVTSRHFDSLAKSNPKSALDFLSRSMDHSTVGDYAAAIADLSRVIALRPDFAPAYLQRATMQVLLQESRRGQTIEVTGDNDRTRLDQETTLTLQAILADLNQALQLDPLMAVAHYNRGTLLMQLGAHADALDALNEALRLDPTLGAAYFNRGFIHYTLGNEAAAIADLSRAGQLSIPAAYPLLKRMQK